MVREKAPRIVGVALAALLTAGAAENPRSAILGTVVDAQSRRPVAEVVVTASPSAPDAAEHIAVSQPDGRYRIPDLPPGDYTLRFERELFEPYSLPLSVREGRALATIVDDGAGGFLIVNPGAGLQSACRRQRGPTTPSRWSLVAASGAAGTPREADSTRTPWAHTVDAQLSARYGTADQHLVTLSIGPFNLLNAQAVLREETLLPLQYQAPRQLRLGVRCAF